MAGEAVLQAERGAEVAGDVSDADRVRVAAVAAVLCVGLAAAAAQIQQRHPTLPLHPCHACARSNKYFWHRTSSDAHAWRSISPGSHTSPYRNLYGRCAQTCNGAHTVPVVVHQGAVAYLGLAEALHVLPQVACSLRQCSRCSGADLLSSRAERPACDMAPIAAPLHRPRHCRRPPRSACSPPGHHRPHSPPPARHPCSHAKLPLVCTLCCSCHSALVGHQQELSRARTLCSTSGGARVLPAHAQASMISSRPWATCAACAEGGARAWAPHPPLPAPRGEVGHFAVGDVQSDAANLERLLPIAGAGALCGVEGRHSLA